MVVIFGFGPGKHEDLGEVAPTVCPNCHNQVFLHHVRSKKSVRLYFVPVVPYGTDDYLVCPVCSRGLQLSTAQLAHLRPMSDATAHFRAGRLPDPPLRARADRFWRQLGETPAAQQPPPAPASGAFAPAQSVPPAQPAAAPQPAAPQPAAPAPQPAAPAQPAPAAADDEPTWITQLRKLTQLHDQGALSAADYDATNRTRITQ